MQRWRIEGLIVACLSLLAVLMLPVAGHADAFDQAAAALDQANAVKQDPSMLSPVPPNAAPPRGNLRTSNLTSNGLVSTLDPNGNLSNCELIPEVRGGLVIGKIVPCMVRTIEKATERFSEKMVELFRPLLYIFLTLVVTLYGVRVASGEPEIHKHGFMLLVKVALVITILDQIPNYFVPKTYEIMKQSQEIVIGALDNSSFKCSTGPTVALPGSKEPLKVWVSMDCITGKLFGYTAGTIGGGPNMVLVTSFFGLLTGFLFGGTWGVVVFFGMIGVLVSMFMLVVRVIMAFLTGYLTICLMLIISPLLMPLVFMKSTEGYFQGVWKNILAGFLMPVVVTSYAMLALMLYDKMLFSNDSIVKNLFTYAKVSHGLGGDKKPCNWEVTNKVSEIRATPGANEQQIAAAEKKIFAVPTMQQLLATLGGSNDACGSLMTPVFNMDKVVTTPGKESEFAKGKESYNKIFENLATLFILSWLIQQGLTALTGMLRNLTGAGGAVISSNTLMQEFRMEEKMNNAKLAMAENLDNKSGGDFVKAAPEAFTNSAKSLLGGVIRN